MANPSSESNAGGPGGAVRGKASVGFRGLIEKWSPGWIAFLAACLVITGLMAWWAVGAIREDVHENLGGLVVCGIVALVTVPFSIALILSFVDTTSLTSPCPACGHVDTRGFGSGPAVCGSCFAYLRADGRWVHEVGAEAVEELPWFRLRAADLADGSDWRMPAGCALCEAPAADQRTVAPFTTERDLVDKETADAITVGLQTAGLANYTRRNTIGQVIPGGYGSTKVPDRGYDTKLHGLRFGLCGEHSKAQRVVVDWTGDLGFRGYRAYREFCRLNGFVRRSAGPRP